MSDFIEKINEWYANEGSLQDSYPSGISQFLSEGGVEPTEKEIEVFAEFIAFLAGLGDISSGDSCDYLQDFGKRLGIFTV
jgi:hypothetical protein